jgi:hypothetical protein
MNEKQLTAEKIAELRAMMERSSWAGIDKELLAEHASALLDAAEESAKLRAELAAEREACAKICRNRADELNLLHWDASIVGKYTNAELQAERRLEALVCESAIRSRS